MRNAFKITLFIFVVFNFVVSPLYSQELVVDNFETDTLSQMTGLELSNSQFKNLSTKIDNIAKMITNEYLISDTISLSFYVLKYFSEIGEYEIIGDEIIKLANGFLKISKKTLPAEIWSIIIQIKKIKFGKKQGKNYVQIFSKNKKGIIYKINEYLAAEDSSKGTLVKSLVITDGAEMYFDSISTAKQYRSLSKSIRKRQYPISIPSNWFNQLNEINSSVKKNILFYLNLDSTIPPLHVKMKGVGFNILTQSIFKELTFEVLEAFALPGMTNGEIPLPSTIFKAKAKLLNLQFTLDQ